MHWLSRAALEFIGQGGFGYKFNALRDEESSRYGEHVKKIGWVVLVFSTVRARFHNAYRRPALFKTVLYRRLLPWLAKIGSPTLRRKVVENVPSKIVREYVEVVDILESGSKAIYEKSKKALEDGDTSLYEKVGRGKDILSVLRKCIA